MKKVKPTVTSIATAKPTSRAVSEPGPPQSWVALYEGCAEAGQGPNSGPTAIAPTIRIALSRTTPQAAIIVASVMKAT